MSPIDAVKTCLTKYVGFSGRARRSEYWWFILFTAVLGAIASGLDTALGLNSFGSSSSGSGVSGTYNSGPISIVVSLALFLPTLAAAVRRLHDTGRSGWWYLINLIPCVGWIIFIVFAVQDSHPDNQYGPNPKNPGGSAPPPYGQTLR